MVYAQISSLFGANLPVMGALPINPHIINYRISGLSLEIIFTADDVGAFPDLRIGGHAGEPMGGSPFSNSVFDFYD